MRYSISGGTRMYVSFVILILPCMAGCATPANRAGGGRGGQSSPAGDALTPPLVTGRSITPVADAAQDVGSLPVNLIPVHGGRFVVSTDEGYRQALWVIRIEDGKGVSHVNFPKGPTTQKSNGLYYGLAAAPDGTLYAAQGNHDSIAILKVAEDGTLTKQRTIATKKGDFPSGLALDGQGRLYVANNDPPAVPQAQAPSSVAVYDAAAGSELGRFAFVDSFGGTPNFPLAVAVKSDGSRLYVGSQRDAAVYVLDTSDPAQIKQAGKLSTGSHPIALLLDKAQKRLFVANAHSDTVSIVDTSNNQVTGTVLLRPDVVKDVAGATPTGLALSANEKWLYVTLGDMNAVAVIDVPDVELEAYVPAGWYPMAVVPSPDGKKLLVANAKGTTVRNPNPPPGVARTQPTTASVPRNQSPLNILEGNVVSMPVPTKDQFKALTQQVLENNRLTPKHFSASNPLKEIGLQAGKIKHVIYIVKENRTYDHVLGDLPQGNGNPRYCAFPRDITPNQHALAERFVLMDNFYDSGEVSGDGWTWSTQAMANEYTIRNVPYQYSDRGRKFDYEGQVNDYPTGGFPPAGPDGKPLSEHPQFKEGAKAIPDVSEAPGGHLWDMARKHNLTYRNYGFFVGGGTKTKDGKTIIPDNWPSSAGLQPGGRDLDGVTDLDFRRFDLDYPDSDAARLYFEKTKDPKFLWGKAKYGAADAPSRFSEWNREFQMMLTKDPTGAAVPNLMTVRFCTDHTAGLNADKHTPRSMVADNDYAVGQLVETVSKSPIWRSCAIVVIEDDAQNGPDHVDAHRSTCYLISPWIKRGSIDHTFHNTASCLRTIELLLGLPPMCQYDATAQPILNWDTAPNNDAAYEAILPPEAVIRERNPSVNEVKPVSPEARLMKRSMEMDFANADKAPADELNDIIWKTVKGWDAEQPPTPRGTVAGIAGAKAKDDDDDDDDDD